jgi:hypothetical protein
MAVSPPPESAAPERIAPKASGLLSGGAKVPVFRGAEFVGVDQGDLPGGTGEDRGGGGQQGGTKAVRRVNRRISPRLRPRAMASGALKTERAKAAGSTA